MNGADSGTKKERFHYINEHVYEAERKKQQEARDINEIEKRA